MVAVFHPSHALERNCPTRRTSPHLDLAQKKHCTGSFKTVTTRHDPTRHVPTGQTRQERQDKTVDRGSRQLAKDLCN